MSKKLKIGLIGAGGIARGAHMNPGWKIAPDCEVVAVCDIHRPTVEKFARDFNIPQVFTDYRELLKLRELDAVDISTPNKIHTPAVLASLAAGKHVLCEKPLAVTVSEVRQMALAAKKAGKLLMTAQHQRFRGESVALKKWAAAGHLGEVYHARVNATRRNGLPCPPGFIDPKLSGGGPCMDIGVHALDTALWVMDFPRPVSVSGTAKVNFAHGDEIPGAWGEWDRKLFGVEDFAAGFVRFANGATLALEASWLQHQDGEDLSFTLLGKKAGVQWPSGRFYAAPDRVLVDGKIQPVGGLQPAHTEEILAFADAVRNGRPSPVPVAQTLYVIAILEGIMKSSRLGREVKLALS
ncbi:MAG: Gfo/Idh/MocA family oxidoreductase [Verrucomicrobiales bacterium]|jgi:predicted dehydrogenase|nr:Gfo/Idh/MocA family oxidoreductase [Verrucomicrobiales bacterium]